MVIVDEPSTGKSTLCLQIGNSIKMKNKYYIESERGQMVTQDYFAKYETTTITRIKMKSLSDSIRALPISKKVFIFLAFDKISKIAEYSETISFSDI